MAVGMAELAVLADLFDGGIGHAVSMHRRE
jgi:hypothetical protein